VVSVPGAVIYVRVSTEDQARENAANLPTQQKKCRDHCQREALPVLKVFVDEESARTANRTNLQELLTYCGKNRGAVSQVVVADLSRLARNVADQGTIIARLADMKIALVSVDEPHIDRSAAGRLSANLLGSVNQFYSDVLSERVRYRMAEAVKGGRFVWRAPLGYRNVNKNGIKNLEIDSERAPLIRTAFELAATGLYRREDIRKKVNAMGLRTIRGSPITAQTFWPMLRNPIYMGWIHSGGNKVRGNFEALVNEELFITVQDVLRGKRVPVPHKRVSEDFPLRGFIRCCECDKPLTAGWARGRGNKQYARYWCYTKGCNAVGISRDGLENHFVGMLAMLQPTAELIAKLPEIAATTWKLRKERIEQEQRQLSNRLNEEKALNQRAIESRIKGDLTSEDFETMKAHIKSSIHGIEEQLKSLASEHLTMESIMADASDSIMNLAKTWLDADLARRQELQNTLFPEGLRFSNEVLLFEPGNRSLMSCLSEMMAALARGEDLEIQDGGPSRI
jgi:site-specific DNA recombinase